MSSIDGYTRPNTTIRTALASAGIITALALGGPAHAAAVKLQAYNADPSKSTVSGISSGGFMAVQMHVAYSASFKTGAAIFAGGPFYCTQGSVSTATGACMTALPNGPDVPTSISTTNSYASAGSIDPTSNLTSTKVYMWSGTSDTVVKQAVMNALKSYYLTWVPSGNITYDNTHGAGHGWISPYGPNACGTQTDPYINNCSTDPEQTFLTQFYGTLNAKNTGTLGGTYIEFDQTEFFDDKNPAAHSVANSGWMYVPASCAAKKACKVHISYHGCVQYYGKIGNKFVTLSGLNQWADTNNIIVVYPQTIASNSNPSNPNGCWDWWAYDDPNFAKKTGRQMLMSKRILDRITSGFVSNSANPAPTGLTVGTVDYKSVALSWTASSGATGYNTYRSDTSGGVRTKTNSSLIAGTSTTATGLQQNTTYYFVVKAQDTAGLETVDSNQVNATTSTAPTGSAAAPTLTAGTSTSTTIPLSWGAVTGASGYNIYTSTSATGTRTAANANMITGTAFTISGLASSTTYYIVGRSVDSSGLESAESAQISKATTAPPYCKLWTDSNYNHVSAARATQNASSHAIAVGSGNDMGLDNTYTQTTLREQPTGYYTIASDCSSGITYPTGVTVGTVTNNSVALSWGAVTGSSGYNVYYSTTRTGGTGLTKANSSLVTTTSYTVTGLSPSTTYYMQVTSQDASGTESPPSDWATATTTAGALAAPTNLAVGTVTASTIPLTWTASGGASGYNAYTSDKSGGVRTKANSSNISGTSFTVTQLKGATLYYLVVTAHDASNNESPASNEVSATTSTDTTPAAPTSLAIAAGTTDTSIPVTFTASGSANLKGTNMYYSTTSGGPYTLSNSTPTSATSYTYTGLNSSTTYYLVARAVNLSGTESANSTQVSGSTLTAKPAQPTNLAVASGTTDTTVPLTWTASTGPNLSGYNVYYGTASGGPYNKSNSSLLGTGTSYTATGLKASTSYYFVARAQNTSAVESVNSNEVAAKTLAATYCKVWFDNNYNHVHASPARATDSLGNAIAIGSGTNMGLDSLGVSSYLKEKPQGYFTYSATVITCP
jgi:poly(3-hydroxybutyrate) depolymerase